MVHDALRWLKLNNQKYYGDIDIDTDLLNRLPEDDIPQELVSIVRQSSDTGIVAQESDGYVPQEENTEDIDHGCDSVDVEGE